MDELTNTVEVCIQVKRDLSQVAVSKTEAKKKEADAAVPSFKQCREADGKFYFKLVLGERVLLQSMGFASPRDAGQRIAAIKQGEIGNGDSDFSLGEGVSDEEVNAALASMNDDALEDTYEDTYGLAPEQLDLFPSNADHWDWIG